MKRIPPLHYALAYVFWFASMGLGLVAAMAARDTVRYALIAAEMDRYVIHANSLILTMILGMILLVFVVVTEHLYRTAVPKKRLIPRFARVAGWTLLILAAMHLFHALAMYADSSLVAWFRLSATAVELIVGLAFLWLGRYLSTKPVLNL